MEKTLRVRVGLLRLPGREHDEVAARGHDERREAPGIRARTQLPAREVYSRLRWIVEFDPIRRLAQSIQQCAVVVGHEFGDDHRSDPVRVESIAPGAAAK